MTDSRVKTEGSVRLVYTGLSGGLEHLKIETRLTDERFVLHHVCPVVFLELFSFLKKKYEGP
jgi:hypothetical protein